MIKQVCKNITACSLALSTALTVFPASSYAKINSEIKQVSEKNLDGETKCIHVLLQQVIVKKYYSKFTI